MGKPQEIAELTGKGVIPYMHVLDERTKNGYEMQPMDLIKERPLLMGQVAACIDEVLPQDNHGRHGQWRHHGSARRHRAHFQVVNKPLETILIFVRSRIDFSFQFYTMITICDCDRFLSLLILGPKNIL